MNSMSNKFQRNSNKNLFFFKMENKVVLITGSSSGIGEATALKFACLGANLVITGSDFDKIRNVAQKCSKVAQKPVFEFTADLLDQKQCRQLMDATIARFGRLDILVNPDGQLIYHLASDDKLLDIFDQTFDSNVKCVLNLVSLAIPHLEQTRGAIVNVSSVAANTPIPSMMIYCAAKSALDMITKCLAIELGPKGIRVNSVNPALTRTPLLNFGGLSEDIPSEIAKNTLNRMRKFDEIEDIANSIVFLSSEKASFITGANLIIDGTNLN